MVWAAKLRWLESVQGKPCGLPSAQSTASFWHTEPSPLLLGHRSTRDLPQEADIVIIGGGITGASVAYHLLNSGESDPKKPDVVLLEAREACWGATGRNGGHCQADVVSHPEDPSVGRFEIHNYQEIQCLVHEKSIDCEYVPQKGVSAIYTKGRLEQVKLAWKILKATASDLAQHIRIVAEPEELAKLRVPTALGAVLNDAAARLWPYKLVARILEDLLTSTSLFGTFNLQTITPVMKLEQDPETNRICVTTKRGTIHARRVILATNGYTSHLLPSFADLIVPCRGQMSSLIPLPSVSGSKRIATSFSFDGEGLDGYLLQRPNESGGHLMFGGGGKPGHVMGVTDDSVVDDWVSHYLRSTLTKVLELPEGEGGGNSHSRSPALGSARTKEMEATHIWTGIMGYSRDGKPWVGEVPDLPGVYISAGYTGHGMPNAWLCGKFVALLARSDVLERDERGANALSKALVETGLPESFLVSKKRMKEVLLG